MPLGAPMQLRADETYLVFLSVMRGEVHVRVVGKDVAFAATQPISAEMDVDNKLWCWGDWVQRDRRFTGSIQLLALSPEPLNAASVDTLIQQHLR
jgi:hypothetical protein